MATNYPNSLDTFTDPVATNPMNAPSHSGQHANANDSILALETGMGAPLRVLATPGTLTTTVAASIDTGAVANATTAIGATGVVYMVPIMLPGGVTIGHLNFFSGTTAASTPTHFWMALCNGSRVMLACTGDQTSTAIAASSLFSLAIATTAAGAQTTFTTTYAGLYYVAIMITGTTIPTTAGTVPPLSVTTATGVGVTTGSSATTGQTTPPTFPTTFGAITAVQIRAYVEVAT